MACWRRSVSRHARLTPEACATGALPSEQRFLLFGPRAPTALASRYWAGCRMLNDRDDARRHEAPDAHRVSRPSELRHLDHPTCGGHFDAPARACRQDLESPRAPGPSIDDHLNHVSDHPSTLAIGRPVDRRRLPGAFRDSPSVAEPHVHRRLRRTDGALAARTPHRATWSRMRHPYGRTRRTGARPQALARVC